MRRYWLFMFHILYSEPSLAGGSFCAKKEKSQTGRNGSSRGSDEEVYRYHWQSVLGNQGGLPFYVRLTKKVKPKSNHSQSLVNP